MSDLVFVTGMARSGTTLTEKIIGGFNQVEAFSQPLPLLLVELKREYLHHLGKTTSPAVYPISDQQFGNSIDVDDFRRFIDSKNLDADYLQNVLTSMREYSGQWFKPEAPLQSLSDWTGGRLIDFIQHYLLVHSKEEPSKSKIFAWKESMAEVYLPYFIDKGAKAVLIVRDPRDVLASMTTKRSTKFTGVSRPILWALRNWRKSIAFKLRYQRCSVVRHLQYESIVKQPSVFRDEIGVWLGASHNFSHSDLLDFDGQKWEGNSSFEPFKGVSTSSVGRYSEQLSQRLTRFVEAACYCELKTLGYQVQIEEKEVESILQEGFGEDSTDRENLSYYFYNDARRKEEISRWKKLRETRPDYDQSMFLYEESFLQLRRVLE